MTWTNSPFVPIVLLIEDQEWTARSLESILGPNGCAVFKAYTGHQGLDILRRVIPDLILVDCHLPDMTGTQVLRQLKILDEVAFVRFASVYRSFRDVDEFMQEMGKLVRTKTTE